VHTQKENFEIGPPVPYSFKLSVFLLSLDNKKFEVEYHSFEIAIYFSVHI